MFSKKEFTDVSNLRFLARHISCPAELSSGQSVRKFRVNTVSRGVDMGVALITYVRYMRKKNIYNKETLTLNVLLL